MTLIGRVRKPVRTVRSISTSWIHVERVLSGSEAPYENSDIITVLLSHEQSPTRLKKGAAYLLTGSFASGKLYIPSSNSIQLHSPELESLIQSC